MFGSLYKTKKQKSNAKFLVLVAIFASVLLFAVSGSGAIGIKDPALLETENTIIVQSPQNGTPDNSTNEAEAVAQAMDLNSYELQKKFYFNIGSRPFAEKVGGVVRYYHDDSVGNVVLITDSVASEVERISYDTFGSSDSDNSMYTGMHLKNPETGLYYMGARDYDPSTARFVSADSFPGNPADPQTLNRYSYVTNNPANYIDPTGYGEVPADATRVAQTPVMGTLLPAANCIGCDSSQAEQIQNFVETLLLSAFPRAFSSLPDTVHIMVSDSSFGANFHGTRAGFYGTFSDTIHLDEDYVFTPVVIVYANGGSSTGYELSLSGKSILFHELTHFAEQPSTSAATGPARDYLASLKTIRSYSINGNRLKIPTDPAKRMELRSAIMSFYNSKIAIESSAYSNQLDWIEQQYKSGVMESGEYNSLYQTVHASKVAAIERFTKSRSMLTGLIDSMP